MLLEEMNAFYNPQIIVQEPKLVGYDNHRMKSSFGTLVAALDQGWQVKDPVQVLPSARNESWIYYFILIHPTLGKTCRLFVPAVPDVEHFVERNHYQVIEGSYY